MTKEAGGRAIVAIDGRPEKAGGGRRERRETVGREKSPQNQGIIGGASDHCRGVILKTEDGAGVMERKVVE